MGLMRKFMEFSWESNGMFKGVHNVFFREI